MLDTTQDKTDGVVQKGRTKTVMTAAARRQVLAGEAPVLQKERLTRNESTKSGCGVVEQWEKLGITESGRGRS